METSLEQFRHGNLLSMRFDFERSLFRGTGGRVATD